MSNNLKTIVVLIVIAFTAVIFSTTDEKGSAPSNSIALEPVVSGLDSPVAITHAGDGSGWLYITLQKGKIVIFDGKQLRPEPFLDITSQVACCGERGLLSVAFHPDYARNGLFYINYTKLGGDTVIARYARDVDPSRADPNSGYVLLTQDQPFGNHNGGQLIFGPDRFLYIGMGDGGSGGDPMNLAQNKGELLGKILRIDVDNGFPYAIPTNNPFLHEPGVRREIWAYGLRNPWRFSFDRETGDLFIADVGQGDFEEINFQSFSSSGGENYGWNRMEGNSCFKSRSNCNDGTLTLPILEYDHSGGNCSITGGYRYRGLRFPTLSGLYFFADYCSGRIWSGTRGEAGKWAKRELLDSSFSISTFGEDEEGEIYLAHHDEEEGAVFHLVPASPK